MVGLKVESQAFQGVSRTAPSSPWAHEALLILLPNGVSLVISNTNPQQEHLARQRLRDGKRDWNFVIRQANPSRMESISIHCSSLLVRIDLEDPFLFLPCRSSLIPSLIASIVYLTRSRFILVDKYTHIAHDNNTSDHNAYQADQVCMYVNNNTRVSLQMSLALVTAPPPSTAPLQRLPLPQPASRQPCLARRLFFPAQPRKGRSSRIEGHGSERTLGQD